MRTLHVVVGIAALSAPLGTAQTSEPNDPVSQAEPVAAPSIVEAAPPSPAFALPVDDTTPGATLREVVVDAAPFSGRPDAERVVYDLDAVLRPISTRRMGELPDWAVAVRLVLSEVGADRVIQSRYGLVEAMGVIETVRNRLDPAHWNPNGVRGLRPWPGCGEDGTFATCANPQQYYGMSRDRALNPASAYGNRELLLAAIDQSVAAWWLLDTQVVAEVTNGATSFHHACGGSSYGADPQWCSSTITGPIVFKGPVRWLASEGRYDIAQTRRVDYRRGGEVRPGSFARYLWGEAAEGWLASDFQTSPEELEAIWAEGTDGAVEAPVDTGANQR